MARQKRPDRFFRLSPSAYEGLHRRYARLIDELPITEYMALDKGTSTKLSGLFDGMMEAVYKTNGATFSIDLLAAPQVREFIGGHAAVLDSSFAKVEMSEAMRRRLQRSDYIFSGLKTFHELNEAFPALIDSDGNRKPFETFLNDVRKIDRTYNRNYLRAEYNFAVASAEMAAKWDRFAEDGDEYNLQYRTVGDDRVRPEHAALNGVTLPMSDPFWAEYYPPNGWNCRCSVTQVRKSKYPVTDHDDAMERGAEALQRDKKGMFHFNPGIEGKTFPDYNPYTISRCRDCDIAKGTHNKFVSHVPDNELCAGCKIIRGMNDCYSVVPTKRGVVRIHSKHGAGEAEENIDIATYLAEKHGYQIDLLPNPHNEKSADSFNHTLGYKQEYKVNSKPTKSAIDNSIRSGAEQADHLVIKIESDIDFDTLTRGIRGRVMQSKNISEVIVIRNGKDLVLSRDTITAKGFKMQQEDFK